MTNHSTPGGWLEPNFNAIPSQLIALTQWFLWRAEPKPDQPGKFKKRPRNLEGVAVSKNNPSQMSDFDSVHKTFEESEGEFTGVGISLLRNGIPPGERVLICIDLDKVRNPETGGIEPWAMALIREIDGYVEVSPSGTGVHIWAFGEPPAGNRNRNLDGIEGQRVEFYGAGAFITVTGHPIGEVRHVIDRTDALKRLYAKLGTEHESPPGGHEPYFGQFAKVDVDSLPIKEEVKRLIKEGTPIGKRSDTLYSAVCSMVNSGLDNTVICSVLTDRRYGLSEKALEERHGNRVSAAEWLLPQIAKARATSTKAGAYQHTGGHAHQRAREEPPDWTTGPEGVGAEDEWPRLVPLDTPDLPSVDLSWLPGWAGDYAQALAGATEVPPELPCGMVLAACATAVAQRLHVVPHGGYYEPCNLWIVCALPPGTRKSAVQVCATEPLIAWERKQCEIMEPEIKCITSSYETMEARAKEMRSKAAKATNDNDAKDFAKKAADLEAELPEIPIPPQLWTSDATPERLGALLADHGECMAWLSSEGGLFDLLQGRYSNGIPNLDLVLKSHSGDPERVDRGSRPPVYLRNPRLTIGLAPQPEVLRGLAAKPGFRGRGLLGRFLYLLPPSPLGTRTLLPKPIPPKAQEAYTVGLTSMLEWPEHTDIYGVKRLYSVEISPKAYAVWHQFALGIERQMLPGGKLEHFTDWGGKTPGAAIRLAGVLHGIKHAQSQPWATHITEETMESALKLMGVFLCHSLAALDLMGADPIIALARTVWQWIERGRQAAFTVRDAFNALRGTFPRVHQLLEALEPLVERGYLEIIEPPKGVPGRPPSPTVRVRPEIVEGWR